MTSPYPNILHFGGKEGRQDVEGREEEGRERRGERVLGKNGEGEERVLEEKGKEGEEWYLAISACSLIDHGL